jgi:hypothetical protein
VSSKDEDLPEEFRNHPTMDWVDGAWRQNLTKLEEWYWQGLQEYRDHGAARVHLSFTCVSQDAAEQLLARLQSQAADSLGMRYQGLESGQPVASLEEIRAQIEGLQRMLEGPDRPDATISILESEPGWRIKVTSPIIEDRQQLASLFDSVRALLSDSRWSLEGSGVGP